MRLAACPRRAAFSTKQERTTAININKTITVKPIAICQSDACDTLLIADANTGKGICMGYDLDWQIDPENGDLGHDAEKIEGVYGEDEEAGDSYELVAHKLGGGSRHEMDR